MSANTVSPRRAVFVDAQVPDLRTLLDGARPGHDVFVLDSGRDGLAQIASVLSANHLDGLSEIYVVSHGAPGRVQLGAIWLDADGLAAHAETLAAIGAALAPGGSLRLYGCEVAAGAAGRHFLDALSLALGGADVAASARPTGSATLGGDWELEVGTGPVAAGLPFTPEALAAYRGVLGFLNGEQRVNQTQPPNQQSDGVITRLSNGTYVVVWMDNRDVDRTFDLDYYGRFLDANGNPTGNEFLVAKDTTTLVDPNYDGNDYSYYNGLNVLALPPGPDPNLPNGGFIVIGSRYAFDKNNTLANTGNPHNEFEVVGRYFTNSGTAVGSEFVISTSAGPNTTQRDPSSAVFDDGSFVVTWLNVNSTNPDAGEITGQRFNAQHQPVGGKFQVNSTSANTQDRVDIAALTDGAGNTTGKFVAVWKSQTAGNTDSEIFARVFNADGSQAVAEFRVNTNTALYQDTPSVTALANGGFVVVYQSLQTAGTGNYDIYFRAFNASGVQTIAETRVNDDSVKTQLAAAVEALPDGGFLVTWAESNNDNNDDVRGQRYNAGGDQVGSEFTVNQTTVGNQTQTYLTKDPVEIRYDAGQTSQQAVITWTGGTSGGSVNDTFARTLEMHTAPSGTNNSKTILANQTYTFQASDFGFSDQFDGAGDTFTSVIITSLPTKGSLTFNNAAVTQGQTVAVANLGLLKYTPDSNGDDGSFTFQVKDNGDTSVASDDTDRSANTFSFDNSLPNTPPALTGAQTALPNGVENATYDVSTAALLQGWTDAETPAGSLTVNNVTVNFGTIVAINGGTAYRITPQANYDGLVTISYNVSDGTANTPATRSLTLANLVEGTAGKDILLSTAGPDAFDGKADSDTASYVNAGGPVTASLLSPGSNTGAAAGDTYTGIENLRGSGFADSLSGDAGNNIIEGGAGADQITGNGGSDYASYEHSGAGVSVDLASGINTGGDAQDDTLTGIRNLIGSAQIDTLTGDGNSNALRGGAGADVIGGAGGNDTLKGETGDDDMTGGLGNDSYVVDSQGDVIHEDAGLGSGQDTVLATVDYALADGEEIETLRAYSGFSDLTLSGNDKANTVAGSDGDDTLDGGGANDRLFGFEGADTLTGGDGADRLDGGADADDMSGGAGADTYFVDDAMDAVHESDDVGIDTVYASADFGLGDGEKVEFLRAAAGSSGLQLDGNDLANTVIGGGGIDILGGAGGADSLFGLAGNDILIGGDDSDKLSGGDDDDRLTGAAGLDQLTGGAGTDRFVFETVSDSRGSTRDLISDFSKTDGDLIDLQGIDADASTNGDQAFDFIGATAFTNVAGQVRQVQAGTNTLVEGDVTGDGKADFAVLLRGVYTLDTGDFVL